MAKSWVWNVWNKILPFSSEYWKYCYCILLWARNGGCKQPRQVQYMTHFISFLVSFSLRTDKTISTPFVQVTTRLIVPFTSSQISMVCTFVTKPILKHMGVNPWGDWPMIGGGKIPLSAVCDARFNGMSIMPVSLSGVWEMKLDGDVIFIWHDNVFCYWMRPDPFVMKVVRCDLPIREDCGLDPCFWLLFLSFLVAGGSWSEGIGRTELTDVVCPMYTDVSATVRLAERTDEDRPVILCEYSHSMNNSNGNLHLYWKEFWNPETPRLQGGYIWDMIVVWVSVVG